MFVTPLLKEGICYKTLDTFANNFARNLSQNLKTIALFSDLLDFPIYKKWRGGGGGGGHNNSKKRKERGDSGRKKKATKL